jgi:hypothetical protein
MVQTFDLSECSQRYARAGWATRTIFGAGGVLLAVLVILILGYQLYAGKFTQSLQQTYGVGDTLGAIAAGVCIYVFLRSGPGAVRLTVSESGLQLEFPSGRTFRGEWNSSRFRLKLYDYRRNQLATASGIFASLVHSRLPRSLITSEALVAILAEARKNQLTISTREVGLKSNNSLRDEILVGPRVA